MSDISTLLDKVKTRRSIPSDMALAASLSVSRSIVSEWRKGTKHPSDEHICALAKMAGESASNWLVTVQASRSTGAARKAWAELARQLGVAASVAAVALIAIPAAVGSAGMHIMLILRSWARPAVLA